ncbi:MAG: GNAT family N-acetyltransferase [Pseudomonadota bacterium]|nr:GNAT family N-acetyltransferase [Pseudomonadota bacterium]
MERLIDCVILPAGPGDADDLARVHIRAWRETYAGLLPAGYLAAMNPKVHARRWRLQLTRARAGEVVLSAEGRGGLVGYCAGAVAGEEAEIFTLYLLRAAQHVGLGRRLFAATARVLAAGGAVSLNLWVLNGNRVARAFYARNGGRAGAERPVRGWGGEFLETAYRWDDIGSLSQRH